MKFFTTIQGLWVVFSSQKRIEGINSLSIYSPGFTQAQENNSKIVKFTKNLELNYIIHYRIHATALSEESAVDNLLRLLLVNEPREEDYTLFPNLYLWSETTYVTSVLSRSKEFLLFPSFYFVFNLKNSYGIGYLYSEELVLATTVKISSYGWVSDQRPIPYDENRRGTGLYFFLQYKRIL